MPSWITCPVCDSSNVDITSEARVYKAPFGTPEPYVIEKCVCNGCQESGDFRSVNDKVILAAMAVGNKRSMDMMLDALKASGYSEIYLERIFSLPFGSLRAWNGDAAALALLRVVSAHPQLAEEGNEDSHEP